MHVMDCYGCYGLALGAGLLCADVVGAVAKSD